jgi:hypothetical protein
MNQTEYKIDENLIRRISEDNRVAKLILMAYLDELEKNPSNKTNQDFHRHYAARLIRAIENKPNNKENVN